MFDSCRLVQTGFVGQQSCAVLCCMLRHPVQLVGMRTSFHTEPPAEVYPSHLLTTRSVSLLRCLDPSEYSSYASKPVRPTFVWYPVSRNLQQAKQIIVSLSMVRATRISLANA